MPTTSKFLYRDSSVYQFISREKKAKAKESIAAAICSTNGATEFSSGNRTDR